MVKFGPKDLELAAEIPHILEMIDKGNYLYVSKIEGKLKVAKSKRELEKKAREGHITNLFQVINWIGNNKDLSQNDQYLNALIGRVQKFQSGKTSTFISWLTYLFRKKRVQKVAGKILNFTNLYLHKKPKKRIKLSKDLVVKLCKEMHQGKALVFDTHEGILKTLTKQEVDKDDESRYLIDAQEVFGQMDRFYTGNRDLAHLLYKEYCHAYYVAVPFLVRNPKQTALFTKSTIPMGVTPYSIEWKGDTLGFTRSYDYKNESTLNHLNFRNAELTAVLDLAASTGSPEEVKQAFFEVMEDRVKVFRERELHPRNALKRILLVFKKAKLESTTSRWLKIINFYRNPLKEKKQLSNQEITTFALGISKAKVLVFDLDQLKAKTVTKNELKELDLGRYATKPDEVIGLMDHCYDATYQLFKQLDTAYGAFEPLSETRLRGTSQFGTDRYIRAFEHAQHIKELTDVNYVKGDGYLEGGDPKNFLVNSILLPEDFDFRDDPYHFSYVKRGNCLNAFWMVYRTLVENHSSLADEIAEKGEAYFSEVSNAFKNPSRYTKSKLDEAREALREVLIKIEPELILDTFSRFKGVKSLYIQELNKSLKDLENETLPPSEIAKQIKEILCTYRDFLQNYGQESAAYSFWLQMHSFFEKLSAYVDHQTPELKEMLLQEGKFFVEKIDVSKDNKRKHLSEARAVSQEIKIAFQLYKDDLQNKHFKKVLIDKIAKLNELSYSCFDLSFDEIQLIRALYQLSQESTPNLQNLEECVSALKAESTLPVEATSYLEYEKALLNRGSSIQIVHFENIKDHFKHDEFPTVPKEILKVINESVSAKIAFEPLAKKALEGVYNCPFAHVGEAIQENEFVYTFPLIDKEGDRIGYIKCQANYDEDSKEFTLSFSPPFLMAPQKAVEVKEIPKEVLAFTNFPNHKAPASFTEIKEPYLLVQPLEEEEPSFSHLFGIGERADYREEDQCVIVLREDDALLRIVPVEVHRNEKTELEHILILPPIELYPSSMKGKKTQ
jgi:hypothetical protein